MLSNSANTVCFTMAKRPFCRNAESIKPMFWLRRLDMGMAAMRRKNTRCFA